MATKDYYLILGVPRTASQRKIRDAYRHLAKAKHPDVIGAEGTAAFSEIAEAYETLSDPRRRSVHNHELDLATRAAALPERGPVHGRGRPLASEPVPILHHEDAVSPSFERLWDHLMGSFFAPPKARHVEALNLEVILSPEEARDGGVLPIGVPAPSRCPSCGGTGSAWLFPCLHCDQRGWVEVQRRVDLAIPPGMTTGRVLEVSLEHLGIENLYLRVHLSVEA